MRTLLLLGLATLPVGAPHAPEGMRKYRSKEANIKSNAPADEAKAMGERIDHYCELFEEFYDELGLRKKNDNVLKLRLFATYEEYEEYYKRGGGGLGSTPLAYFSPSLNSIVMYSDPADVALQAVVFHESSHQFLNRYTYDAPKWLNEGLAEYFEGWKVREGEPAVRRPHFYDLAVVKQSLADDKPLGLRELVEMDRKVFDEFSEKYPSLDPYLHYATSWSIVYHCLEGGVEEDRVRLIDYLEELTSKPAGAEFEVDDWPAFIARWRETVTGLEPEPTDAADHFIIASGARRSGDLLASVRSLRKAVELDPELPGARYWLGYSYYYLGGRDQAREEFQAAMAVDPKDPGAVYYLARLELGIDYPGEAPDAQGALEYARQASDMADGENPAYLFVLARCQLALGEGKDAIKTARKMVDVADDESRDDWQQRADEIEQQARQL